MQEGEKRTHFLEFLDQPSWSIVDMIGNVEAAETESEQRAVQERYMGDDVEQPRSRLLVAREDNGTVSIVLRDGQGRPRIRLAVPEEGDPAIEVLDADGTPRSLIAE